MSELRELTKEEADALTKDLTEVLAKHNAELGVTSTINLMKREEGTLSPIQPDDTNNGKEESEEKPDSETKENG